MHKVETLKFFHILLVMIFFSGTIVAAVSSAWAAKAKDVQTVQSLIHMAKTFSIIMIYPAFIAMAILGVFLAHEESLSLTHTGWLKAAYAASGLGFLVGVGVMGRNGAKLQKLADRDAPTGQISPELRAALDSPMPKIVGGLLHTLVVYLLVLMVYKPYG